jgi:plasmid stabilization system protein ParE
MTYRIVLTPRAKLEFRHEIAYSERNWGRHHARSYSETLRATMRRIAEHPFLFAPKPQWGNTVRAAPCKGNWIVYHVAMEARTVTVLGFPSIYCTADYSEDL